MINKTLISILFFFTFSFVNLRAIIIKTPYLVHGEKSCYHYAPQRKNFVQKMITLDFIKTAFSKTPRTESMLQSCYEEDYQFTSWRRFIPILNKRKKKKKELKNIISSRLQKKMPEDITTPKQFCEKITFLNETGQLCKKQDSKKRRRAPRSYLTDSQVEKLLIDPLQKPKASKKKKEKQKCPPLNENEYFDDSPAQ